MAIDSIQGLENNARLQALIASFKPKQRRPKADKPKKDRAPKQTTVEQPKEAKSVAFTLPYPPSVNHYLKRTKLGVVYKTPKAKEYCKTVARQLFEMHPTEGPVELTIKFWTPDNRRRDVDNILKVMLDSLSGILYHDDSQIFKITLEKMGKDGIGRVEIESIM